MRAETALSIACASKPSDQALRGQSSNHDQPITTRSAFSHSDVKGRAAAAPARRKCHRDTLLGLSQGPSWATRPPGAAPWPDRCHAAEPSPGAWAISPANSAPACAVSVCGMASEKRCARLQSWHASSRTHIALSRSACKVLSTAPQVRSVKPANVRRNPAHFCRRTPCKSSAVAIPSPGQSRCAASIHLERRSRAPTPSRSFRPARAACMSIFIGKRLISRGCFGCCFSLLQ